MNKITILTAILIGMASGYALRDHLAITKEEAKCVERTTKDGGGGSDCTKLQVIQFEHGVRRPWR